MRGRAARLARAEDRVRKRTGADLSGHWRRVFADRLALFERFLADLPDDPVSDRAAGALDLDRVCGWLYFPGWCPPRPPAPAVETLAWMRACWDLPNHPHPHLDGTRGPLSAAYVAHLLAAPPGAELSGWGCRCGVLLAYTPTTGSVSDGTCARPRPPADTCPACGAAVTDPGRC